jgi:predicted PurR-regulated permease PerM
MLSSTDQREPLQQGATTTTDISTWAKRLLFLRIILISVLLIGILVWLLSFVINPILILIVAALLAYAVVPLIDLLHRVMPRALAIVLVYVVAIIVFGVLAYLGLKTFIPQLNSLGDSLK